MTQVPGEDRQTAHHPALRSFFTGSRGQTATQTAAVRLKHPSVFWAPSCDTRWREARPLSPKPRGAPRAGRPGFPASSSPTSSAPRGLGLGRRVAGSCGKPGLCPPQSADTWPALSQVSICSLTNQRPFSFSFLFGPYRDMLIDLRGMGRLQEKH